MPLDRFMNYKLIPENYVPDNIHQPQIQPKKPKLPLVEYNKQGEPIGFTWNYGDTIYLEFNTEGSVTYEPGDPGYKDPNLYIEEDAETYLKSKTLLDYLHYEVTDENKLLDGKTTSDEQETSSTTDINEKDVTEYLGDDGTKIFQVLIYNFRYEVVAWCEVPAAPKVVILSDSFYPCSLVKGTYKLRLNLIDKVGGSHITLIPSQNEDGSEGNDCTIFIR